VFRGISEALPKGDLFGLAQGSRSLPQKQLLFWTLGPDVTTETAIAQLRATPDVEFTAEQSVSVMGMPGVQFDAVSEQKTHIAALGDLTGLTGATWDSNSAPVQIRFVVLHVAGRTLVIYIEAPTDEFNNFVMETEKVLGTIQFDG
jgi:hypothetical protein